MCMKQIQMVNISSQKYKLFYIYVLHTMEINIQYNNENDKCVTKIYMWLI